MAANAAIEPYFKLGAKALVLAFFGAFAIFLGDDGASGFFTLIGILALAVGGVLLVVAVFRYVLDPLEDAARNRSRPTQFTLADFLILVFWLQAPLAMIHAVIPNGEARIVLDGVAWVMTLAAWLVSVQLLSRAGIVIPRHRAIFLAVLLPFAYLGSLTLPPSGMMLVAAAFITDARDDSPLHVAWLVIALAVIAGGLQWAAVFVRRMVAATAITEDSRDAAEAL